jgi:class 3 adenylate cyclase
VNVHRDYIGHDVNVASRVADRARGGQILVSESLHEAVDGKVKARFRRAGTLRLRGAKPIRLYEVTALPKERARAAG